LLRGLLPEGRFPALRLAIASGALDDDDDIDAEFNFGLLRILDGIAALIEEYGSPASRLTRPPPSHGDVRLRRARASGTMTACPVSSSAGGARPDRRP